MLDAYIIEQILDREEEKRRVFERPSLRLPLVPEPFISAEEEEAEAEAEERHVIIIDL